MCLALLQRYASSSLRMNAVHWSCRARSQLPGFPMRFFSGCWSAAQVQMAADSKSGLPSTSECRQLAQWMNLQQLRRADQLPRAFTLEFDAEFEEGPAAARGSSWTVFVQSNHEDCLQSSLDREGNRSSDAFGRWQLSATRTGGRSCRPAGVSCRFDEVTLLAGQS